MRHSWRQKSATQHKHRNINKQHTNINSTNSNKQQQTHTCFLLLCVLLRLLCSSLTYKGTCGIVGNRKSKTTQTQKNEQTTQKTNSTNNTKQHQAHTCFLFCVLFCLLCSLLTYKGTCGIVGNKKKQTKPNTEA